MINVYLMQSTKLLKKVVRDYTRISDEFSASRKTSWPEFELFKNSLEVPKNSQNKKLTLLDLGCGNGRLYDALDHSTIDYTGVDNNSALLKHAKKLHPDAKKRFKKGDMLTLPFPTQAFDTVWCIAALHHLPTPALQKKALVGVKKNLKKGGTLMITVWNLYLPKYKKYIDKKSHHSYIPWGNPVKAERFYYAFTVTEFHKLLKSAGFSKLKKVSTAPNIAYVCTK